MKEVVIRVIAMTQDRGFWYNVRDDGAPFASGTAPTYHEAYLEAINFARSIAEDA